jgi:hypothetical protein
MNGHSFEDGIVFLQFHSLSGVFLVLGGNVPGSTRLSTVFMLGAFHNYLHPITFFCHFEDVSFSGVQI